LAPSKFFFLPLAPAHKNFWLHPYIQAMTDPDEVILPPHMRSRPGRPKKAMRTGANEEAHPYKVSRAVYDVKCGSCGVVGHNFKTCPQPENPTRKKWPNKSKKSKDKVVIW
jgi:hypothetical protein